APPNPPASPSAGTFAGPKVMHPVTPAVPRGVGPMITTDVQVDVAVAIDANGKVTSARVASTKGTAAGLLTIEALKAAQLFRFRPARENNRNVASSMILTFRFARTAK
ncbi:MAG TPA: TonB family protein, partial [Candidatus Solibacter sp.]|nr:TonB family protein [Candidatus Solibacter sp.]